MGHSSIGTRFAAWAGSLALTIIVVLAIIIGFSSPSSGVSLSKSGFHLFGNATGAFKQGIVELGEGFNETGGEGAYVPDPAPKSTTKAPAKKKP